MTTQPDQAPVLETRGLVVRFGGLTALSGVDLAVPKKGIVGLVGPNGAGKSTFFGVCSGLLRPTDGRVFLDGTDASRISPQRRARLGLARTFQQPEIFFGLTVREHLVLAYRSSRAPRRLWLDMLSVRDLRSAEAHERARVDYLLRLLLLEDIASEHVDTLPLGMMRRVELGRALACDPKILLLDEPLSGLDASETAQLADALHSTAADEGIALLLVEHDVATVLRICSEIYVLDFGRLIAHGTPDDIRSSPAVKAAYLGDDTGSELSLAQAAAPVVSAG